MRKLKALGLALASMAALVAVAAPAAQAETGTLTSQGFPAIVTGPQQSGFTFDIGMGPLKTVTCESKLDATLEQPTDPVTFQATYNNCTSEPGGMTPVTITMNGCDYQIGFSRPGTTQVAAPTGKMHASIACPDNQVIEIHIYESAAAHAENNPICEYDIGPQGPVPAGIYHNVAAAMPIDVLATLSPAFTAKSTIGPAMVCGGNAFNQHLPITLTGSYTLRAFADNGGAEGAAIGLHVD